eukprot:GHVH01004642.1.p1 GENE.GHVH01004642.1~~GHVH01004642.1.p1  ORF type:complete len:668 (-),score=106.91 GHVH01004642.1:70-2037(-)
MSATASAALAKALAAAKKINATPGFDENLNEPRPVVLDQSTKHARKIYAGGLPAHSATLTSDILLQFFNEQLEKALPVKEPGDVIVACFLGPEKRYAFLEHRSITEAAFTLTLDGIYYDGQQMKIRRPQDYNIQLAEEQQRSEVQSNSPGSQLYKYLQSNHNLLSNNHSNNPEHISGSVDDGPNKVFIGGLPHTMTDEECKEILQRFGPLKAFHLVKERNLVTGEVTRSKGFAFCEWRDPNITEMALMNLNGQPIGQEGRVLTVRRALPRQDSDSWTGPSLIANTFGSFNTPTPPPTVGFQQQSSSLMLTNGKLDGSKMARYGHMGNLGHEAVTAYLSGRLPFQGDFKQINEHLEGLNRDELDCAGFDGGTSAFFPGENRWLEFRELMNDRMVNTKPSDQEEKEFKQVRHELWGIINRPEIYEKFGKPGRAVGLSNLFSNDNDYTKIKLAVEQFKTLVDENIGEVKAAVYHPIDTGVVIIEMSSIADAYRVVRSLNGRHYLGQRILARFILLPANVKQASLLRLKTEIDAKFRMNREQRNEFQKKRQSEAAKRLQNYLGSTQEQWIHSLRAEGMRRKREQDRLDEEAMAFMSGVPSTVRNDEQEGEDINPLELFPKELSEQAATEEVVIPDVETPVTQMSMSSVAPISATTVNSE